MNTKWKPIYATVTRVLCLLNPFLESIDQSFWPHLGRRENKPFVFWRIVLRNPFDCGRERYPPIITAKRRTVVVVFWSLGGQAVCCDGSKERVGSERRWKGCENQIRVESLSDGRAPRCVVRGVADPCTGSLTPITTVLFATEAFNCTKRL